MFKLMDLDGNGSLDTMEFASRLSDLGLGDQEIERLFNLMDSDRCARGGGPQLSAREAAVHSPSW